MAKKRRGDPTPEPATMAPNNPFGALAALRDELPPGSAPSVEPVLDAAPKPLGSASPGGKVVLRRETKGRGGKTITRISGLSAQELEALAKQMKKALGCGASVEDEDVVLLGSLVDRAADWLEARGATRLVRAN